MADWRDVASRVQAAAAVADWHEVVALTESLQAAGAEEPDLLRARAHALGEIGRLDDALAAWQAVEELSPGSVDAHLMQARLAAQLGLWRVAVSSCDRLLGPSMHHDEAVSLGRLAVESGADVVASQRLWAAIAAADTVRTVHIADALYEQERLIEAGKALAAVRETSPDTVGLAERCEALAAILTEEARSLEEGERLAEAIAAYRTASSLGSGSQVASDRLYVMLRTLVEQGRLASETGDHELAREAFEAAVSCDPTSSIALTGLARACERLHDWRGAAEAWEQLLDADPYSDTARFGLGVALQRLGEMERAFALLERVREPRLEAAKERALGQLARLAFRGARDAFVRRDLIAAARAVRVAATLDPENEAVSTLGTRIARGLASAQALAIREKDYERGADLGAELIATVEPTPSELRMQVRCLKVLGRDAEAEEVTAAHPEMTASSSDEEVVEAEPDEAAAAAPVAARVGSVAAAPPVVDAHVEMVEPVRATAAPSPLAERADGGDTVAGKLMRFLQRRQG